MVKILFATMARFDPGMAHQAMQTNARFCEGLPLLYYSHTTFQNNPIRTTRIVLFKITTFRPNMTKITAADQMVGGCFYISK